MKCNRVTATLMVAMDEIAIRQCIAALEGIPGDGPEFLCNALKAALERAQRERRVTP